MDTGSQPSAGTRYDSAPAVMMLKYAAPRVKNVAAAPVLPVPTRYTPSARPGNPEAATSACVATITSRHESPTSARRRPSSVTTCTAEVGPRKVGGEE